MAGTHSEQNKYNDAASKQAAVKNDGFLVKTHAMISTVIVVQVSGRPPCLSNDDG